MPKITTEEWIEVQDAAKIMTRRSGHDISPDYVRYLAHRSKIRMKPKDRRTYLYLKQDVLEYRVKQRKPQQPATAG